MTTASAAAPGRAAGRGPLDGAFSDRAEAQRGAADGVVPGAADQQTAGGADGPGRDSTLIRG